MSLNIPKNLLVSLGVTCPHISIGKFHSTQFPNPSNWKKQSAGRKELHEFQFWPCSQPNEEFKRSKNLLLIQCKIQRKPIKEKLADTEYYAKTCIALQPTKYGKGRWYGSSESGAWWKIPWHALLHWYP